MNALEITKAGGTFEDSADRINAILDAQDVRIATIFRTAISDLKGKLDLNEIANLLEQGRLQDALDQIATVADQLAEASNFAFVSAGKSTADMLRSAGLARIVFDQVNLRAVAAMQANRLSLIREFTEGQRRATSAALVSNVEAARNPRAAARDFRDAIGLTENQWRAVASYRRALEQVGTSEAAATDAIGRALRDGRGDRTVLAAARDSRPIPRERVDWLVRRYAERYVKYRSEVIGRTEALRSVHQGNEAAYAQAIESGDIPPDRIVRQWRTRLDGRERLTHELLHGQERGWGETWQTVHGELRYPGDPQAPPVETVQCRCAILTRIRQF